MKSISLSAKVEILVEDDWTDLCKHDFFRQKKCRFLFTDNIHKKAHCAFFDKELHVETNCSENDKSCSCPYVDKVTRCPDCVKVFGKARK
ncbi:MAG: hypothetical protein A2Y82_02590 [Candidatus Buchananbacteria bacterium RBG_13_36_9]|uniref:Uncharacterized protein n=1 Tax=Candidatus Buchananbacteria bacterium RBG_13_36_9 TaxID=1797530 RepID=A0A1G1XNP9_9BACT|nr:MAG: hypothetical protein A2Y82_02590 [Candidatus Buchananbacteria bacterium RBG_13_36_9]